MLAKNEENKVYEVYRMLPPGKHRYFYSVGTEVRVAKNQLQTSETLDKKERKEYIDTKPRELINDIWTKKKAEEDRL